MNQVQNLQQAPLPVSPQPGLAPQSGRGASVVCFYLIFPIFKKFFFY